ncbi:YrhB family protein [Xanthomonas sp. PPL568]|uniref:YrhB domain-containing protein n=1 Tax=Xanthomonas indica TaxID=2912242 RepID=UPI001F59F636|nr:YrhB domain-containing protein [Xanthomonas indica]MCI2245825.1 YrhB family protein [Xanthomonas indica]
MINFEEALKIAEAYICDDEYDLQISEVRSLPKCWIFFFQTREFIETRNPSAQLAGNGPFLIDKESGKMHILNTFEDVEKQISKIYMR